MLDYKEDDRVLDNDVTYTRPIPLHGYMYAV